MASNPKNVRSNVLMKLQEALDEEAILEEQMLSLMHHFADRGGHEEMCILEKCYEVLQREVGQGRQIVMELFGREITVGISDDESLSNEDVPMEDFKIYSNPLFDNKEIISNKIDPHYFNTESNLIESLPNRDTLFDSSPKFDHLEEFSESLSNDSIPLLENESFNFDKYDELLFPHPPPKPPDVFFDYEPDSGELILAVMNNFDELIENECFDPAGGEIDVLANVEDDDYFPFMFVI
nr:hypothetical protein [Tanacetum cinerariifolium]